MKLFLDTCVLVDYYAQREPFAADANRLRIAQAYGDVELWTALQSCTDALHILHDAIPADKLEQQMQASITFLHVCGIEAEDFARALDARCENFEDCLISRSAEKVKADYLITRNLDHFSKAPTKVLSPAQFLEMMRKRGIEYEDIVQL